MPSPKTQTLRALPKKWENDPIKIKEILMYNAIQSMWTKLQIKRRRNGQSHRYKNMLSRQFGAYPHMLTTEYMANNDLIIATI